jgi:hypothetical protein
MLTLTLRLVAIKLPLLLKLNTLKVATGPKVLSFDFWVAGA